MDINKFTPRIENNKKDNIVTFISVGTLYYIKNHKLLINAFKMAHDKDTNMRLIIAGDGELKGDLLRQIKQLELEDCVELIGNQADVGKVLRSADIYCCTSTVEGLPISVLEAMACGLPVITTPAGGVIDIVDARNGIIVKYDEQNIADAMLLLSNDSTRREELGHSSRAKAEIYSIDNCVAQYMNLYDLYSEGF